VNTLDYLRQFLQDSSSGVDLPAAIVVETVQAEGGVKVARAEWLQGLERLCREFDILLIVDDIQVGNGRTGTFFSFERSGIRPDMVTLSKSIGGIGLPLSLLLMDSKIDIWKPAEHTGTFRGHNLAFVAATAALSYWQTEEFPQEILRKGQLLEQGLTRIKDKYPQLQFTIRCSGLIGGLAFLEPDLAKAVTREAFQRGLIIELAGSRDEVIKFLPPLIIEDEVLQRGINIIDESLSHVLKT
jgi:diaminobutyrate-2-oxoglutarate transaminase